jgi:hypothetical protein
MDFRRLIATAGFLLITAITGFGQGKVTESITKEAPPKVLNETVQKSTTDQIKAVPITDKSTEAMRLQSRKATMQQMHQINKASRKSMMVKRRR